MRLAGTEVEALSPYEGELPDPIVYESPDKVVRSTEQAVERCLQRGFGAGDVAVVSLRGRERSALQSLDHLGPWRLRRFTGRYDDGGGAVWADGDLMMDSVRRFKGQAAPAVVLTECDFADLDPMTGRLLFVGLTRARVHLEWVLSRRASHAIERALAADQAIAQVRMP